MLIWHSLSFVSDCIPFARRLFDVFIGKAQHFIYDFNFGAIRIVWTRAKKNTKSLSSRIEAVSKKRTKTLKCLQSLYHNFHSSCRFIWLLWKKCRRNISIHKPMSSLLFVPFFFFFFCLVDIFVFSFSFPFCEISIIWNVIECLGERRKKEMKKN